MKDNFVTKSRKYNPPLKQKYSVDGNPQEEVAARSALKLLVTDEAGSTYLTTSLVPEIMAALIKARYSRTSLSAKQLLWREFVAHKKRIPWKKITRGQLALDKVFDSKKAEAIGERILIQYGDDSVFELGGVHIFFDRVSQIAAKIIEDARIGLSPLEKSTRYVVFDQEDENGDYSFYKDPKLMESKYKNLYLEANRKCFAFYTQSVVILQDHLKKQIPIEGEEFDDLVLGKRAKFKDLANEKSIKAAKAAYGRSIRSKACDIARGLLPASTFTNIGVFANARALSYLFTKMAASSFSEIQTISQEGVRESKKVLPKFFDVVDNQHGQEYQRYLQKTELEIETLARKYLAGIIGEKSSLVELVKMSEDSEVNIIAGLFYPYSNLPLRQIIQAILRLSQSQKDEILYSCLKHRKDRRHKLPRGFELAGYELVFDILANFGSYRDLQRHRMLTQQRQKYTVEHGFDMAQEFKTIGLDKQFNQLMEDVEQAFVKINRDFPLESQYLVNLSRNVRWYFGMNLREAFWLTELRSTPQGHFSYRTIVQQMYELAAKRYPTLRKLAFKDGEFVNMDDYSKNLERMASMQRIEKKLAEIEKRSIKSH